MQPVLTLALLACGGAGDEGPGPELDDTTAPEGDADTDADSDADADADADADSDADTDTGATTWTGTLPNPYDSLDPDACEGGLVANTATAWFVGDFTVSGSTVTGTETAAVYWSDPIVSTCGFDPECRVVWTIAGTVGDPGACATCDLAIDFTATIDPDLTTCPVDRVNDFGETVFSTAYDVRLLDDGTTEVSFSSSGTALGGWYWAGDDITYVADDPYCLPYPDDATILCP